MADQAEPSEAAPEPTVVDTNGAAITVALASPSTHFPPEAAAFLERQSRLVDLQIENLEEDRALQHRHLALRYFGDRLRIGLQLLAILFGLLIVVALAALVWQAHDDHGLVIEAFSAPPAMAQDGLTGQVVAARLLDRLQALQAATRSARPAATYQNNWGSDVKVEIPETGITFGDLERLLRDKLGRASHVTGEVIKTADGVAITARIVGQPPQTFTGTQQDFDTLIEKAAEDVYRVSQPYRYAEYLSQHGREPEAVTVAADLAANGAASERAWAYGLLSQFDLNRGDLAAARADLRRGLAAGGDGVEWVKITQATVELWSGHEEQLLAVSRDIDHHDVNRRRAQVTEAAFAENKLISSAYLASQVGDYARSAADYRTLADSGHVLGSAQFYLGQVASALALDHDIAGAGAMLALAPSNDAGFLGFEAVSGYFALPGYDVAAERGDWAGALAQVRATEALVESRQAAQPALALLTPVLLQPLEAHALVRTGDRAGAQAVIATTPLDCYRCLRERGEIAAAAGDWAGADRWFAEAVRQAPSIPFAYAEWGETLLARGDPAGAIAKCALASQKGPRFADPYKTWGDALARQGKWRDALARYDEALKYAPAWLQLHRARDTAATRGQGSKS